MAFDEVHPIKCIVSDRKSSSYWSGAHTRHRLRYHIVFVPKYRHRVLTEAIALHLKKCIEDCCIVHDWSLVELNIQSDHVHLLLQIPPSVSLSNVVKLLKGGSSRSLQLEFPSLEEFFWKSRFWGEGFFAETVGAVEEETIRRYIRDQQKEHGVKKGFSPKKNRQLDKEDLESGQIGLFSVKENAALETS
jgi:putative transposase